MADPGATTSVTLTQDLLPVYVQKKLLEVGTKNTVMAELGEDMDMPENSGVTAQAARYARLALPNVPLAEGVTPVATPLTVETVTAILEQWGILCQLTDKAVLTVTHPVMRVATQRTGEAMGQLWDREIQDVLRGGSVIVLPNNVASESLLGSADVVSSDLMRKILATLKNNGARKPYTLVVDNYVAQDIGKDSVFQDTGKYQDKAPLLNGEIGRWLGFTVKESNLIPIVTLLVSGTGGHEPFTNWDNTTVPGGEVGFLAASTVPVVVTRLDPIFGYEVAISAAGSVTNAAAFVVDATIQASAPSGVYKFYVGLENSTVATEQVTVTHTTGTATVRTFIKSGVPTSNTRFVTQATGQVAPPPPPTNAANLHTSYAIAAEAFGVVKLGKRISTYVIGSGASKDDPLDQRRYIGAKTFFKALILNQDFLRVVKSTSTFN